MAKRKETIQKIEIKKDLWDHVYTVLMLIFTGVVAYSAFVTIPQQIAELTLGGWERVYYEEGISWLDKSMETSNPNEIIYSCINLSVGTQKTLEETFIQCNNGNTLPVIIRKQYSGQCFWRYEGEC